MGALKWWTPSLFSKLSYFIFLMILVLSIGTLGYMLLEGWDLVDAFYMTIITISTVGFQEIHELTTQGKLFTAALIVSSFGTFAYAVTSITNYLVGGEYRRMVEEKKRMKDLQKLHNHVIICGFGRVGRQVADDLASLNTPFVILEKDPEVFETLQSKNEYHFVKADATQDESLIEAGLAHARAVITCLPNDSENVYVVLSSRELRTDILIVSRANNQSAVSKLKSAGASNVIMPDSIGGSHMASLIANPDVMEFLDTLRVQGAGGAHVNSIAFSELPEDLKNKTVEELESYNISGVTIIGFKGPEGNYIINPAPNQTVVPHSKLFVLGSPDQLEKFKSNYGLSH